MVPGGFLYMLLIRGLILVEHVFYFLVDHGCEFFNAHGSFVAFTLFAN